MLLLMAVLISIMVQCRDEERISLPYINVTVDNPTGTKLQTIGTEFDPHFFSQNVTQNASPADWDIIVKRVTDMKMQSFRVMVLPEWYEPVNDNNDPSVTDWDRLTFNSREMQSLYKVLDLAQQNDIRVTLVLWGCVKAMSAWSLLDPPYSSIPVHFLAEGSSNNEWCVAPKNVDEWCENFSILVQYLVSTRGYTCIKEITPMNEPSTPYHIEGTPMGYVDMCKKLDARFRADNIRDKVLFNLSDDANDRTFLQTCTENLSEVADLFNSHTYGFGYQTPNTEMLRWEQANRQLTEAAGKKHFIGEFGSNQTVGATRQTDIDLYERGILMTRIALNMLNAGASGLSYWILMDLHYHKNFSYEGMQQLGLWRYKKEDYVSEPYFNTLQSDYEPRPQYYSYALLTQFIRPESDIYPVDLKNEFAAGTAFKNKDGKWTYVFANGTASHLYIKLENKQGNADGEYAVYQYIQNRLPAGDGMIQPTENITVNGQKTEIIIQRQSVYVCQQK